MRLLAANLAPLVAAAACCLASASAFAADKMLVVPIHGHAGAAFDASVFQWVAKPLKRAVDVLPAATAASIEKRLGQRPSNLHVAKNVRKLGHAAAANYVLIVEATGRKSKLVVNSSLVSVATGETVFSDRYALPKGRLTRGVATQIVEPLVRALHPPANPAEANGHGAKAAAKLGWPARDGGGDPTEPTAADGGSPDDAVQASVEQASEHGPKWRPAMHFEIGPDIMQRNAGLRTNTPGIIAAPCYCGSDKDANPFFPALHIGAEFYPFALAGDGSSWEDGFGVRGDLTLTEVKSYIDTSPATSISSVLYSFSIGPTYRLVLWDSKLAPDVNLDLGYGIFSFPLSNGAFPGVSYASPYVGLRTHVPLGLEELALVGGFNYQFAVNAGNNAGNELGTQTSGYGINAEGGLRFSFLGNMELSSVLRYQLYSISYAGLTSLPGATTQLNAVGLSDHVTQIMFNYGINF